MAGTAGTRQFLPPDETVNATEAIGFKLESFGLFAPLACRTFNNV